MFAEIINMYGVEIIGGLLVTLFGIFGMWAKKMAAKYLNTETERTLAKIVVQFVEQTYKELHGEAKMSAAIVHLSGLLAERGIFVTEHEMRVMIEAAVGEFNEVFKKPAAEK